MKAFYGYASIDVTFRVEAPTMEEAEELVEGVLAPWSDDTHVSVENNGVDVYEISQPALTGDCEADGECSHRCCEEPELHNEEGKQ